MLELKEITYDNLKAVIKLSDTLSEQDKKHVAPNVVSLAEEKDWPVYILWRFMMGTEYQGKGYGKQTLDHLVQKCKEEGRKYLYVSSTRIDPMPYQMYIRYGFVDTGLVDNWESVLKLRILNNKI